MIINHFQEFCYTFDSKPKKDLCWESTNSQDQNVAIENAPSQIYSCWSPRVLKKKIHSLTTRSWHVTIDLQRVSTLLWVDPILPVSFGVSRVQNFFTGEGRMSRIPTSFFICIAKGKNDHLKRGEDQTKKQNTPQRSYSISSSFRVIVR